MGLSNNFAAHEIDRQQVVARFFTRISRKMRSIEYTWFFSRIFRNRLCHSVHGNMNSRKGFGKGKKGSSPEYPIDEEQIFRTEILNALPAAAILRQQAQLISEDWSVPVRAALELNSQDGVAVVYKSQLATVLRNVGFTRNCVAILTTQPASQLYLKNYPSQEVWIRVHVRTEEGELKEVSIKRYLIQLGFGRPVQQLTIGREIEISESMIRMTIKLPSWCGWSQEAVKGSTITTLLAQHINIHAIEALQVREDQSATFLTHQSFVKPLMQASGKDGIFVKVHPSCEAMFATELYWLPEEINFEDPLALAGHESALGLIAKNSKVKPRFAIHFENADEIEKYTKSKNLPTFIKTSRWRLEGLAPNVGAVGAISFLESQGWVVDEILYFGTYHCLFTSTRMGSVEPMFYRHSGTGPQQLRFKALNSLAQKEHSDAAQKARATSSATSAQASASKNQGRTMFLRSISTKAPPPGVAPAKATTQATGSPMRVEKDAKRPLAGNSGETPPPKQNNRDL